MKFSLAGALCALQLFGGAQALWPEPIHMTNGSSVLYVDPNVKFTYKPLSGKREVR
jgi:hypothetical protein